MEKDISGQLRRQTKYADKPYHPNLQISREQEALIYTKRIFYLMDLVYRNRIFHC